MTTTERVRLAIAERAGACTVEPAPGGRLLVHLTGELDPRRAAAACSVAKDRGWRAYRAIEAYAFSSTCRRRTLLDHFGDPRPGEPIGRCCDVCDPHRMAARPADDRDPADPLLRPVRRPRRRSSPPRTRSFSTRSRPGACGLPPASRPTRWPTTGRSRRSRPRVLRGLTPWRGYTGSAPRSSHATPPMCWTLSRLTIGLSRALGGIRVFSGEMTHSWKEPDDTASQCP